ncbi:MAG: hypothetical protein L0Z07_01700 [Planctomycetes bacterium]|nr:hypothetical protein [Planctomycetota bacterium]
MVAVELLFAVALVSQVASGGDRYSTSNTGSSIGVANPLTDSGETFADLSEITTQAGSNPSSANGPVPAIVSPPPVAGGQSFHDGTTGNRTAAPNPSAATTPGGSSAPITYPAAGGSSRSSAPSAYSGGATASGLSQAGGSTKVRPAAMMQAMLTAPQGSGLAGQPVTLAEAVAIAPSRDDKSERIDAYWNLCANVSDYYLGLREEVEMRWLHAKLSGAGPSPAWQHAEKKLAMRLSAAQMAALASQYRLANLIGRESSPGSLPLPADVPHCGKYDTRFEQIFSERQNVEAQELAALLPLRYEELNDAAMAVMQGEAILAAIGRAPITDETGTLSAFELLALRRRAFVQIVRDYNRRIARYSEIATPGEIDSARLVSMLISTNSVGTDTRSSSPVEPPSNHQLQHSATTPQQTFAEGWSPAGNEPVPNPVSRDNSVRQASAETQTLRKERSLLVSPQ